MPNRVSLFRKYAPIFCAVIGGTLLLSGLFSINYSYQENKQALVRLQREQAEAAAARIGQYLFDIELRIANTVPPRPGMSVMGQRALEIRLLRLTKAIREIILLDSQGLEYLKVSRFGAERLHSGEDYSNTVMFREARAGRLYRSAIDFDAGTPFMTVALAVGAPEAGVTLARIDLEFLLDGISRVKVGESGHAYAIDAEGWLIAHPDIGLVLNKTSMAGLPQVQAAITGDNHPVPEGINLEGEEVLAAYGKIPQLGWFVFVEEPVAKAYAPLYAHTLRSGLLVLLGIGIALVVTLFLVRRMVRPLSALREGARRIRDGMLDHRIAVNTGDELEVLAEEFNHMAEHLQKSYATLEYKVAVRTRELEESNAKLAALSATDALTGVANRRRFDEVLAAEWSRAARTGQWLALGMIDVDWFKIYNDRYGHQAGDDCLRQVAAVLAASVCRNGDLVARYGGEEFVFVAPATDGESAMQMARRFSDALREAALPYGFSRYGCVTVSIGVAARQPQFGDLPEWLINDADEAMYCAKALGRNRVLLF